ncbi:recombinase family protein [Kitasatospora sp. NPDC048286]|uniref:recombinase family protein n=1 Tax=Kitasatospora sp. NPDC048286 TaxID=3364047 RepID=UPI0037190F2B
MQDSDTYICVLCGKPEAQSIDLYCRKSKLVRGHRQELSTDAQEEQGHRRAHREGYAVRKVWKDIASGFKDVERADFDRALKALAGGAVPALWAYAVDRFSRKGAEDLLKVIGKARVIFDMDGLDSNEPRDRRWIINRAEEAREYSENLSRRVKDTKEEQRDGGLWVAGRAPWGYQVSPDRFLSPDETPAAKAMPSRADVVREIFRRVAEDSASTRDICRWLDGAGVPSPGGSFWRHNYVHRMLRHPAYVGWQVVQIRAGHPEAYRDAKGRRVALKSAGGPPVGLVDEKTAQAAQTALSQQTRVPVDNKRDTRPKHLLTGLLRCGGCGRSMPFGGTSYVCGAANGGRGCPGRASVRADRAEAFIFEAWLSRLTAADVEDPILHAASERWAARIRPEETEEEKAARTALRAAEASLKRLLNDRQNGVYDGPAARYFAPLLRDATEAVESARSEVERYNAPGRLALPFLSVEKDILTASWEAADLPMRRDLLRLVIDRITVAKAPHQGAKFDGMKRFTIEWAQPETAEDDAE